MAKIKTLVVNPENDTEREKRTGEFIAESLTRLGIDFDLLSVPKPDSLIHCFSHYSYENAYSPPELTDGNFVVLNTSGFRHGLTYFFVRALKQKFLHYIHCDSHPDLWNPFEKNVTSYGFVSSILDLPNIKGAFLAGVTPNEALIPPSIMRRQKIEEIKSGLDIMFSDDASDMNEQNDDNWKYAYQELLKEFPGIQDRHTKYKLNLKNKFSYMSVDLDVLEDFPNKWTGHGRYSKKILHLLMSKIGLRTRILAGDICGLDLSHKSGAKGLEMFLDTYKCLREIIESRNSGSYLGRRELTYANL
jgi:hypothetical protein